MKEKSQQRLEIYKIGVEQAIKDNQESAIAWINQKLKTREGEFI